MLIRIGVEFGSNVPMLYCLDRTSQCYIVWVERPNAILFEEICIYYMHFVCWNDYILWTMLIIEYVIYFWVNCVWRALPNMFLLMKLESSTLPYVLIS
jgi:hypothetical protein